MPYRANKRRGPKAAPPAAGLVTEMVQQFADPYAFLRELVQNSIDAGARSIAVRVTRTSDGLVQTSTIDDGCGMTPQVIEGALLTLFVSSKEGDRTKVGKYGVGFVSVFALQPEQVVVETWRNGREHRLTLAPDHSYVLEEVGPKDASGTRVTLVASIEAARFGPHVAQCREALLRWCCHAAVPITLSWFDEAEPASAGELRIDTPLSLEAVICVERTIGDYRLVVGCAEPNEPNRSQASFFNRGLTLHTETQAFPRLEGVRFKIDSPLFTHTLSRDNVRRDEAFQRALEHVRMLARKILPERAKQELRRQALAVAEGADAGRYAALLATARSAPLSFGEDAVVFPLTDPVGGERALSADALASATPFRDAALWEPSATPLTRALAAAGRPVVLCPRSAVVNELASVFGLDAFFGPRGIRRASELFVLVVEAPDFEKLGYAIAQLLAATGNRVAGVGFAGFSGASLGRSTAVVRPESERLERLSKLLERRGFRASRRVLFDVGSPAVRAAGALANRDLASAAQILTRIALLDLEGAPSASENDALLARLAEEQP